MNFFYNIIITIIIIIIFLFTTFIIFTTQNLHLIQPLTHHRKILIQFHYNNKPYINLSPSPSPSPSPLPYEPLAPAPLHHVRNRKNRNRNRLPLVPSSTVNNVEKTSSSKRRKKVLIVVFVCVGGVMMMCLIGLFLFLWKQKVMNKSLSCVKKTVSLDRNFYLQSLGSVLEPIPVSTIKNDGDRDCVAAEDSQSKEDDYDGDYKDLTMMNIVSNSENKFDEQVVFDSPINEQEMINIESNNSSDDESFHSFCNSHDSSNPRTSDVSITCETLPLPPPPPPPPPFHASTSSTLKTISFEKKPKPLGSKTNQTSIPPPPLPPPFPKGSVLMPPPPPPPCQSTRTNKDGSPLPKLKPLHWDKVRAASDRTMVWDKLRSSSFEFDEEMIESLFSYNNMHNANEELKSKSPSPSKHVLEPKRLQNITILLKALNLTAEQVCCALVQGNGLNLQQLEVLIKMEPTKEEEAKLAGHKGDMGSAETFVATILAIPHAFSRIEALLYRETFEDELTHLRKTFSVLEEACKELRSSRLFLKLLEAVLKTGNRMNVGTIRGGAKAFKLDALLKLADVKGTDGKTTLLHFVVQEIVRSEGIRVSESIIGKINQKGQQRNTQQREEDYRNMGLELVAGLSTELCNVKKTATIDFDVIASSVSNLSQGMDRLQRLVNDELLLREQSCKFGESMKSFMTYAVKHLKELEQDERKVLELVKEITEYFHGNMSKDDVNPLRIFVTVRDFLAMLDVVCRELKRSKVFSYPNPLAPFQ